MSLWMQLSVVVAVASVWSGGIVIASRYGRIPPSDWLDCPQDECSSYEQMNAVLAILWPIALPLAGLLWVVNWIGSGCRLRPKGESEYRKVGSQYLSTLRGKPKEVEFIRLCPFCGKSR